MREEGSQRSSLRPIHEQDRKGRANKQQTADKEQGRNSDLGKKPFRRSSMSFCRCLRTSDMLSSDATDARLRYYRKFFQETRNGPNPKYRREGGMFRNEDIVTKETSRKLYDSPAFSLRMPT